MRKMPASGEVITLSAADPLNLVGILVPGERVPAISGKTVTFRDGVADVNSADALQGTQIAATG
jgi:ATP-dependent Lhr-like helicase